MDKKWKGRIINSLRKLSFSYPPRNAIRKQQQVGPATFECEHCGVWIYEGSRELSQQLEKLPQKPPNNIIKAKACLDHKEPVVPLESFSRGDWDWHEYIERMFCDAEGYQLICKACHDKKTKKEDEIRKKYRQSKKKA